MKQTKSTKRALLGSVLALFVCCAMLLGTTYAWFTDTAVSANNKIVSGTLDVELYQHTETGSVEISENQAPVFPADILWEPGYTHVVYLSIKNAGDLPLKYRVILEVTETTDPSLVEEMSYEITRDAKIGDTVAWTGNGIYVNSGNNATEAIDVTLYPTEENFFALAVHMDEDAANKFMGQSIAFDIKVLAGQIAQDAPYAAVGSKEVGANSTEPTKIDTGDSVKVVLPAGVPAGDYSFTMTNKNVVTDAATNATTVTMDLELARDGVKVVADGSTVYNVEVNIGTGKRVLSVTHNGVALYADEFSYDANTGILSFETASFSPFSFTYDTVRTVTGLSGAGTEADPYLINDYYDLCWFRDHVNTCAQDGSSQYQGKFIKLTADIDLAGIEWTPIGSTTKDHGSFYGNFDGDGHTISNLYVSLEKGQGGAGFFAKVSGGGDGPRAVVKNLVFENVDIYSPDSYVGAVIANAGGNSEIRNVTVKGEIYVVGYGYVGGIVGHGYPDMYDCHVEGDGEYSYIICNYWCGGGIIGYAGEGGTILDGCTVKGMYISSQYGAAGALAGLLNSNNLVKDSHAENVSIELNSTYACGYACGNGEESTYDNVSVKNVTVDYHGTELKDIPVDGSGYHNCDNSALIFK